MVPQNSCSECGSPLPNDSHFCNHCGTKIGSSKRIDPSPKSKSSSSSNISSRSGLTTLLLAIFLGWFGAHRFYVGKMGTALLMIATIGGLGIWILVDLIFIVRNEFTDDDDKKIILTENPSPGKKAAMTVGAVIGGIVIFVLTVIFIAFYLTSGLTEAVKGQLSALRAGDMLKAYSYTSKDFQNKTSLEAFKEFVNDYPSLKYNKSASFSEREVKNDYGLLKGSLTASDGAVTPVEYRLIKEDGTWKILGIIVSPTGAGISKTYGDEEETSSRDSSSQMKNISTDLSRVYEHQKFVLHFPANWEYAEPERGTVVFRAMGSNATDYAYISIQTVYSKKMGGKFISINDIVSDLRRQIPKNFSNASIIDQGDIELPNNHAFHGKYIVSTYAYDNQLVKQMDIILVDPSTSFFYVWEYATPVNQYDTYMPVAKKMFESWVINK